MKLGAAAVPVPSFHLHHLLMGESVPTLCCDPHGENPWFCFLDSAPARHERSVMLSTFQEVA